MTKKKVVLLILDGLGYGEKNIANPFRFAQTKNFDQLKKFFPFCLLNASGYAVGLPSNEPASCEIGHLTIGTGVIFYSPVVKINLDIESGQFFKNEDLLTLFRYARKYNSRVHFAGLLSEKNNIADLGHLIALLKLAKQEKFIDVYLHLFTDGIDSPPKSALNLLERLLNAIKKHNHLQGFIPETNLEKALYSCEEITGFIVAVALVMPNKKLSEVTVERILSKFKEPSFARGVNREIILKAEEMLGLKLEELAEIALKAMQEISDKLGL